MSGSAWTETAPTGGLVAPAAEERAVHTSIPALDSFFPGLRPCNVTLIDSPDRMLLDLTSMLCVNGVRTLERDVVWVDGGCTVDPYEIGRACRRSGMNRAEVLDSISVARAFTAYQLVSLIDEMLEEEVARTGAGMVVVSCLPEMFQDKEMRKSESNQLVRRCMERLRSIARSGEVAVLVTSRGPMRSGLRDLIHEGADEIVRIENASRALRITLPLRGESIFYHAVPRGQTTLEEFVRR